MSDKESPDFASADELAALAKGELDITLKTMPGKKIKIRKATIGEIAEIMKMARESELEQSFWLTYKCMLQPKLTMEQIRGMAPTVQIEIGNAIAKFTGIDKKNIDKTQNLLEIES